MKLELYKNINEFMDDTMEIIAGDEVRNNIVIGNCLKAKAGLDSSSWLLASVKDGAGSVRLTVMQTPPYNICLYETGGIPDDSILAFFAKELESVGRSIPGVITEKSLAERFSALYLPGTEKKKTMDMRVYKLDSVNEIPVSNGRLRRAMESDLYFLPYWRVYFSAECGFGTPEVKDAYEKVKSAAEEGALFVWEDGHPVSQAGVERKTLTGAVITEVYTPPYYRGSGYASSCVSGLSRHMLESGYKFCSLFTDLNNPISNSIYMKIGYNPVCDFVSISFGK